MKTPARRNTIHGCGGAGAPVTAFASVAMTGVLAIATASVASPPAMAQQPLPMVTKAPPAAETPATTPLSTTDAVSQFDAKFAAALASDYNYRGYTLSDHLPSASANLEVTYWILFASVNTASVQIPELSRFQMTDTVGLRPVFGPLTLETGVAFYSYPGSQTDSSYPEVYLAPSYAVTSKLTMGVNLYYASDYYRTGAWENYNAITGKYDFGSGLTLSAELGRQGFGTTRPTQTSPAIALPDYIYGNVGLTYTYKALSFDLRFHATTLSKQSCFLITGTGQASTGSNGCDPAINAVLERRPVRPEIGPDRC